MNRVYALAAAGNLALAVGGYWLGVHPAQEDTGHLRSSVAQTLQANAAQQAHLAKLQEQAAELPAVQRRLEVLADQIPPTVGLPVVVRQLTTSASAAGVSVQSLAPGAPTALTDATGGTSSTVAGVQQVPVDVVVSGSYFQVQAYLHRIEDLPRAVRIVSVALARNETGGTAGGEVSGHVSLRLFTAGGATAGADAGAAAAAAGSAAAAEAATGGAHPTTTTMN
ncbi:Tfp pilus assembly protein PilO [Motilibacter rhizosphaerae]|uniref:Tfp pilus assembly protein PilO n=1 Tax=Motilibacter rhizosphaerae TaxID=598652 RepID=A0A4Q7NQT4_9ACTN|nr:Tfp pilus assembly protein PilO [Motilibacter rhizosphaerae]